MALLLVNEECVSRYPQAPSKRRPEKPQFVGAHTEIDDQEQNIHGKIDGEVYSKAMIV
jgi:hypothetical protein